MPNSDYDFHTGVDDDGIAKTAVCFLPGSGLFLEFQDPETHDKFAKFKCPRTGKVVTYDGRMNEAIKSCMGGHIRAIVPAERWTSFREEYLQADNESHEYAREKMQELTEDPPAKAGVKQ
jgi:hypothetical protein